MHNDNSDNAEKDPFDSVKYVADDESDDIIVQGTSALIEQYYDQAEFAMADLHFPSEAVPEGRKKYIIRTRSGDEIRMAANEFLTLTREGRLEIYRVLYDLRNIDAEHNKLTQTIVIGINIRAWLQLVNQYRRASLQTNWERNTYNIELLLQRVLTDIVIPAWRDRYNPDATNVLLTTFIQNFGLQRLNNIVTADRDSTKVSPGPQHMYGILNRIEREYCLRNNTTQMPDEELLLAAQSHPKLAVKSAGSKDKKGITQKTIDGYRAKGNWINNKQSLDQGWMDEDEPSIQVPITEGYASGRTHLMGPEDKAQDNDTTQKIRERVEDAARKIAARNQALEHQTVAMIGILRLGLDDDIGKLSSDETAEFIMQYTGKTVSKATITNVTLAIKRAITKDPEIQALLHPKGKRYHTGIMHATYVMPADDFAEEEEDLQLAPPPVTAKERKPKKTKKERKQTSSDETQEELAAAPEDKEASED